MTFVGLASLSLSGSRNAGTKGKEREAGSQAASKGVLFFSVHEAATDTKASGTWYLAITYARTVMVYEAAVPRHGTTRAWSFVKELYAPFPIKAATFAPAAVDDEVLPFTSLSSVPVNAGPTKLRVASANGPLSTSKKASFNREHGSVNGSSCLSGASSPTKTPRISAAPTSWHKADLCLLLSFGRRAVLVRLRDSDVRELELRPLAQLIAAPELPDIGPATQLSLQPQHRKGSTDPQIRVDRSRPASMLSESGLLTDGQIAGTPGHSRNGSVEHKLRDAILDKRSNKHNWVGFSSIEAQVFVRQWSNPQADPYKATNQAQRPKEESLGLSPMAMSMAKDELELLPISRGADYKRANGDATQTSTQDAETYRGDREDDTTCVGDVWGAEPSPSHTFIYPAAAALTPDRIASPSRSDASAISQELEYLCAPLLTLHPIDLTPSSCGAQSLVLPLSQGIGQGAKPVDAGSGSAAHALFPELGGDAGVVAFDWRGADDFRIFIVGIAG
ncbi:hypothetical protein NDA16_004537 [Ustilago loliicola]|nr:hypothetical protein NDA16_004537 [Ustilago loliicola]